MHSMEMHENLLSYSPHFARAFIFYCHPTFLTLYHDLHVLLHFDNSESKKKTYSLVSVFFIDNKPKNFENTVAHCHVTRHRHSALSRLALPLQQAVLALDHPSMRFR